MICLLLRVYLKYKNDRFAFQFQKWEFQGNKALGETEFYEQIFETGVQSIDISENKLSVHGIFSNVFIFCFYSFFSQWKMEEYIFSIIIFLTLGICLSCHICRLTRMNCYQR